MALTDSGLKKRNFTKAASFRAARNQSAVYCTRSLLSSLRDTAQRKKKFSK